jgi:hypothetical protein
MRNISTAIAKMGHVSLKLREAATGAQAARIIITSNNNI